MVFWHQKPLIHRSCFTEIFPFNLERLTTGKEAEQTLPSWACFYHKYHTKRNSPQVRTSLVGCKALRRARGVKDNSHYNITRSLGSTLQLLCSYYSIYTYLILTRLQVDFACTNFQDGQTHNHYH